MATKFYLHDATSPVTGANLPGATTLDASSPTVTATGASTNRIADLNIGTTQASGAGTTGANTSAQSMWLRRWISAPLAAQTISAQTITYSGAFGESNTSSNYDPTVGIYLYRPSTGATVGAILAVGTLTTTEPAASETAESNTATSTSQTAVAGDILVIESWRKRIAQGAATAYTNTVYYGGTTEASASNNAAFVNFANTLSWQTQAVSGHIVQAARNTANSGTSLVLTLPAATTAGNSLILVYGGYHTWAAGQTFVGTHDTLTLKGGATNGSDDVEIAWKINITGGDTVFTSTVTNGGPQAGWILEVSNITAFDVWNTWNSASSTPQTSTTGATAQAVEFVIAANTWLPNTTTWSSEGAGYTAFPDTATSAGANDVRFMCSYLETTTTGTQSNSWTGPTVQNCGVVAAFIFTVATTVNAVVATVTATSQLAPLFILAAPPVAAVTSTALAPNAQPKVSGAVASATAAAQSPPQFVVVPPVKAAVTTAAQVPAAYPTQYAASNVATATAAATTPGAYQGQAVSGQLASATAAAKSGAPNVVQPAPQAVVTATAQTPPPVVLVPPLVATVATTAQVPTAKPSVTSAGQLASATAAATVPTATPAITSAGVVATASTTAQTPTASGSSSGTTTGIAAAVTAAAQVTAPSVITGPGAAAATAAAKAPAPSVTAAAPAAAASGTAHQPAIAVTAQAVYAAAVAAALAGLPSVTSWGVVAQTTVTAYAAAASGVSGSGAAQPGYVFGGEQFVNTVGAVESVSSVAGGSGLAPTVGMTAAAGSVGGGDTTQNSVGVGEVS